ncbi:MAG: HAD family hydrolase [Candidatus Thorarchaeota archaeon]|nr:MAG: HAD family hydrolase [Candidatus Thorarchaeota archaeon]
MSAVNLSNIRAILFDLHHTITKTRVGMMELTREAAEKAGIDFSKFSDEQLGKAIQNADKFMKEFQIENRVDIHWGGEAEDWSEVNRVLANELDLDNIPDETLLQMEKHWKHIMATNWESLVEDAKETLEELHRKGYILGICTRRHDDPEHLLEEWGIRHLLSTVHYSGVPGYAKPSPFTLLKAAEDIGINPKLCAYVGNYVDADVGASRSAEMLPILTTWSDEKEKDLAPEGTIVIDQIKELLDLFEGPPN